MILDSSTHPKFQRIRYSDQLSHLHVVAELFLTGLCCIGFA